MKKTLLVVVILACMVAIDPQAGFSRGYGGARAGGGNREGGYSGSHEGSYSGNRYSGSHEGSYSNGSYSGSRQGSYSGPNYSGSHEGSYTGGSYSGSRQGSYNGANYSGSHESTYSGSREGGAAYGAAGYHGASGYAVAGYRGVDGAVGAHVALPTDGGFAAAGAVASTRTVAGVGAAHITQPINAAYAAARGAAVTNSFNHPDMFGQGWYGAHPGAWEGVGWTAEIPWMSTGWSAMGDAIGLAAGVQPIAYNYGTNVTYQGDQVYNDAQPVATADEYYQQASTLAQSAPAPADDDADWMPLGTFGLVRHEETDPPYVIQLAVDKSGAVAGNYCDMLTDHNLPVHGAVDPQTQKLAWTVGHSTKVVGEVGLYNLTTQNEVPALIHIGPDKTQQWLLVRLKQPEAAAGQ
jgi:hypothetical protein